MRKIYVISSLLLMLVVLIGCGKKSDLPVIKVPSKEVTLDLNEPFDALEGVKAVDKKKKDLTEQIEVKLGDFNNLYEGQYTITYTVKDSKGKVGTAKVTVNVVDKIRSQAAPVISSHDAFVLQLNDFTMTNQQLYQKLKETLGLQMLIEIVDKDILSSYELEEGLMDDYIESIKSSVGEEQLTKILARLGYYQFADEEAEAFEARVKEFLSLNHLRREAAKQILTNELSDTITKTINEYREDLCVINLTFNTKAAAEQKATELSTYTGDKIEFFKTNYVKPTTTIKETYLSSQIGCDYDRMIYNNTPSGAYKTAIFDTLEIDQFTAQPILSGSKYVLAYVVSQANLKSTYNQDEFKAEITDQLVSKSLTETYVNQAINKLRLEKGLKIYDPLLASNYKNVDASFTGVSELTDNKVIASYNGKTLTTDAFYDLLKANYGATELINAINYNALKSIEAIKLSDEDLTKIDKQIQDLKAQYEQRYSSQVKFNDFLVYQFNVTSEQELKQLIISNELTTRYLLGHNSYSGVAPVTQSEIDEEYENYFEVKASHILFKFDATNEASKQLAKEKAMQILHGVGENETAYIKLNNENFAGLNNISPDQYAEVFGTLASLYSEDGSKAQKGDLGVYTPGMMVKPFEDATRVLINAGVGSISTTPVESQFGYHIIMLTEDKTPEKPANYDSLTEAELNAILASKTDMAIVNYHNVVLKIKETLENKRFNADFIDSHISTLRDELNIQFNDESIEEHYEYLNSLN